MLGPTRTNRRAAWHSFGTASTHRGKSQPAARTHWHAQPHTRAPVMHDGRVQARTGRRLGTSAATGHFLCRLWLNTLSTSQQTLSLLLTPAPEQLRPWGCCERRPCWVWHSARGVVEEWQVSCLSQMLIVYNSVINVSCMYMYLCTSSPISVL